MTEYDESLLVKFKEKLNGLNYFLFFKYGNIDKKQWINVIISSVDYIGMALRNCQYLNNLSSSNIDMKSMKIYSLISQIDIITEAIKNLHSIFFPCEKRVKKNPFEGRKEVFKDIQENMDDDEHFKHLRACFGAHPVDIKDKNGKRYFALCPNESIDSDCDLEVTILSLDIPEDKTEKNCAIGVSKDSSDRNLLVFQKEKIRINELLNYLKIRYEYLNKLIAKIDDEYDLFIKKECMEKPILKSDDTAKQIEILIEESKKRLDLDPINLVLKTLKMLFSVTSTEPKIAKKEEIFKSKLKPLVDQLYVILQTGDFDQDYESFSIVGRLDFLDTKLSTGLNELQKLFSWIYEDNCDWLLSYLFNKLKDIDLWNYNFSEHDDKSLILLKLHLLDKDLSLCGKTL